MNNLNNSSNIIDNSFSFNLNLLENQQPKIKLDEILDNISNLKVNSTTADELKSGVKLLRRFKLFESAKWCSELLLSINDQINTVNSETITGKNLNSIFNKTESSNNSIKNISSNFYIGNKYLSLYQKYKSDEANIKDILSYAFSLLDLKEYLKCKNALENYAQPIYPTAMFIYYYCEYLLAQEKMSEEMIQNNMTKEAYKYYQSNDLNKMEINLSKYIDSFSPFMNYLYGVILKQLKRYNESKIYLIKALSQFPFLWSCWVELCSLSTLSKIGNIFSEIDDHWMKYFYLSNFLIEKNHEQEAIVISTALLKMFPNSLFLLNTLANANYLLGEYDRSLENFEKLLQIDPNRYENLDTYSNILFVKENYCELSNLAYNCYQNNKYHPESCCVIGNYYAVKGEHAQAVSYFKKATDMDYSFLPAWILLGHEYLEMKYISKAIESYRTAVDIDPNDYRAWYGLGQTYEIHQLFNFALYYYMNAARVRPNDSRMWTALAISYEKLNRKIEAIKCYEKSLICKDNESIALNNLGKLYMQIGEEDKGAICLKMNLDKNIEGMDGGDLLETCICLGKYYKKKGNIEEANKILAKLKDYEGTEKDLIDSLVREINNNK